MAFQVDHSQVKESNGVIPIGEYEVIVKYAGEAVARTGTEFINITMVVRNDVEQVFQNKYVFHKLWQKKEPNEADKSCGGYSSKQIQSMSKAAGLPNGKSYANLAEWCSALVNACVRVTIEHEEYNGAPQPKVKWVNESNHLQCNHVWEKEATYQPSYPAYNEYQAAEIEKKVSGSAEEVSSFRQPNNTSTSKNSGNVSGGVGGINTNNNAGLQNSSEKLKPAISEEDIPF